MALSTADATRLARLSAAYDDLLTGAAIVRVQQHGGRMVEYGPGDAVRLKQEIDALNAQAATTRPVRMRGAIGFRVNL